MIHVSGCKGDSLELHSTSDSTNFMAEGGLALELKQALALLVLIKAHRQGRVDHTWKSRVDETFPMKSNSWLNQGYIRKGNKFVQSMSRKKHRLYDQGLGKSCSQDIQRR
jgi:hypothetical protein